MASISAFAQSSVELYGGLDTGIVKLKSDTGTTTTNRTYTGGNAGYTSRIGVRGTEDLGGGNKATFNWEAALGSLGSNAADNAAFSISQTGNAMRTAQLAWVSPTAGTVTAGYGMNARHVMAATVAQNDFSMPGNISLGASTASGVKLGSTGDSLSNNEYGLRSNAVAYTSPSFGGLNLIVGAVFGKSNTVTDSTGAQASNTSGNAKVLGGIYANGPLTLLASTTKTTIDGAVAAAAVDGTCVAANGAVTRAATCASPLVTLQAATAAVVNSPATKTNNIVGGMYDLGVAKLGFAHYQDKLVNDVTTSADFNNRGNVITARGVVSGPFEAFALYSKGKYQLDSVSGVDRAQSGFQLAGFYNFSKRTAAYVGYGTQKREAAKAGDPTAKDTMSTIGLRHNF